MSTKGWGVTVKRAIVAIVGLLTGAGHVWGAEYYISASGKDHSEGSRISPWGSIEYAQTRLRAGGHCLPYARSIWTYSNEDERHGCGED